MNLLDTTDARLREEISMAHTIVGQLDHPAHALFLIRPVEPRIPDSLRAWSVSLRCTGHAISFVSNDVLILVMKSLLPSADMMVYTPWLDRHGIMMGKRTLQEWDSFVRGVIADHLFTSRWWSRVGQFPHTEMGMVVGTMSEKERTLLASDLEAEHLGRAMEAKRVKRTADGKKPLRLTPNEVEMAKCGAERHLGEHTRLLKELPDILKGISADSLVRRMHHVAACIVSLCRQHPRIQWNIRYALNWHVNDIVDMSAWHVERELGRHSAAELYEPLEALRALARLK